MSFSKEIRYEREMNNTYWKRRGKSMIIFI